MKWARTSAKKIALGAASIIVVAAFGLMFFLPQPAHAATVRWVNRFYIQVDNKYFYDRNTYDDIYEYVEQGTTDNCADKIIFTFMQFGNPTSASDDTNLEFFYSDAIYNRASTSFGDVMFRKQLVTSTPGTNSAGQSICNDQANNITPDLANNRRVTFYTRDSDQKIVHIATGLTFSHRGEYPAGSSYTRYFRDSEVVGNEKCIDMIIRHPAKVLEGDALFGTSGDVPGSSLLFSVDDRGGLSREAESYPPNSGLSVGRTECKVDGGAVNGRSGSNVYGLAGFDKDSLDRQILAAGIDSDGQSSRGGDYPDDAFIIFIGTEAENTKKNPDGTTDTTPTTDPAGGQIDGQTCKGGALGWIICPIVSAIQTTADLLRDAMQALLTVNPLPLNTDAPIYQIWNNIRNFANIAFVIGFFVIIFSQATSIGISNYGIKRMLPNLVAAAIIANLSYFICSFLIDAFNILGVGMYSLVAIVNGGDQGTVNVSNGAGAVLIGLATAGVGAAFYTAQVVQLFPLLVTAFIGMVITFIVLVARQALLILLVVLSPLIAIGKLRLLPGLEGPADKGVSIFMALLVMYPLIMLLFAGARLAGSILTAASGSGLLSTATDVIALIIQIVMGFAAIFMFKWAIIAKGALGRLAGQLNDATKGFTNRAEEFAKNRQFFQRRQMAREARSAERKRSAVENYANVASSEGWRGRMLRRRAAGGLRGQVAGALPRVGEVNPAAQGRINIAALTQLDRLEQQEINDAAFVLRRRNIQAPGQLYDIARGGSTTGYDDNGNPVTVSSAGDTAMQRAAMKALIGAQDSEQLENLFKDAGTNHRALVNEINQQYSTAKGAGAHFVKLKPELAPYTTDDIQKEAVNALAELSYQKLASQDSQSVQSALEGFRKGYGSVDVRRKLYDAADTALNTATVIDNAKAAVRKHLQDITSMPRP